MDNNLNNNEAYFSCKTVQCFRNHNNGNYFANNDSYCPFCSYNMENNLKLREKIKKEILYGRKKSNIYQTKFLEYIIAIMTGVLVLFYITYYIVRLFIFHK